MSADRVRWEHIQRIYELCGRNVSETARLLNMHRRTLQRILAKHAKALSRNVALICTGFTRLTETRLPGWACKIRTQKRRRKLSL
jgi:hypothetical protein